VRAGRAGITADGEQIDAAVPSARPDCAADADLAVGQRVGP